MDPPQSPNQEGPSEQPPKLPEGWLAQWCARCQTRREHALTGLGTPRRASTTLCKEPQVSLNGNWGDRPQHTMSKAYRRDVPTQPALSVPTPEPTPQAESPFNKPGQTPGLPEEEYEGADRGLLTVSQSRDGSRKS